jgi:hypothetical protein
VLTLFASVGCANDGKINRKASDGGRNDAGVPANDAGGLGGKSVVVDLALNDATLPMAFRGWPLILMGVAALADESAQVVLDPASLSVRVTSGNKEQRWPLELLSSVPKNTVLDVEHRQVDVFWAMTADQTGALALGEYAAELSFANRVSLPLPIEIVDAPAELTAVERSRKAALEIQEALLRNEPARAVGLADAALAEQPDDTGLLVLKALAHEAAGALDIAFTTLEAARVEFNRQNPVQDEPPVTIDDARQRVREKLSAGRLP